MQTKILMMASAALLFGLGLAATFAPDMLLREAGVLPLNALPALAVQALGALYLGFAVLNWMARENLIGGIYSKPVAVGNCLHFVVFALALLKAALAGESAPDVLVLTAIYLVFAAAFVWVAFGSPRPARP